MTDHATAGRMSSPSAHWRSLSLNALLVVEIQSNQETLSRWLPHSRGPLALTEIPHTAQCLHHRVAADFAGHRAARTSGCRVCDDSRIPAKRKAAGRRALWRVHRAPTGRASAPGPPPVTAFSLGASTAERHGLDHPLKSSGRRPRPQAHRLPKPVLAREYPQPSIRDSTSNETRGHDRHRCFREDAGLVGALVDRARRLRRHLLPRASCLPRPPRRSRFASARPLPTLLGRRRLAHARRSHSRWRC